MKFLPERVWEQAREEARSLEKRDVDFRAVGYDNDTECVRLTLDNARKAGVARFVTAKRRDIREWDGSDEAVKILTNPPYGERMLDARQARELYRVMGEKMLPLGENQLYVITPDEEFEDFFGKKADKNRKLYNGMIKCRLYSYYK